MCSKKNADFVRDQLKADFVFPYDEEGNAGPASASLTDRIQQQLLRDEEHEGGTMTNDGKNANAVERADGRRSTITTGEGSFDLIYDTVSSGDGMDTDYEPIFLQRKNRPGSGFVMRDSKDNLDP